MQRNYVDAIIDADLDEINRFIETWSGVPDREKALKIFGFNKSGNHSENPNWDRPSNAMLISGMISILSYMHQLRGAIMLRLEGKTVLAMYHEKQMERIYQDLPDFAKW